MLILNPIDSWVKFASENFSYEKKMMRNLKMHVFIRENDVNYVKMSFQSHCAAKSLNLIIVVSDNDNMNF